MQTAEAAENGEDAVGDQSNEDAGPSPCSQPLSKNAQKKLLKQQRFEAKKAEKKAAMKEHKKREGERKRKEWDQMLEGATKEERERLIESRKGLRKERMEKRSEERENKIQRLTEAKHHGQNIVVDFEFSHLMTSSEIHSLVQQIMYCYAINGKSTSPGHLWLTSLRGEMEIQLRRLPGFNKWLIEKEDRSYIEAFQDRKECLVYLTADSENTLDELDPMNIYIVGGLVDRNRWKGITMKKAKEQGIQTAKLPIGNYLKMSSSQLKSSLEASYMGIYIVVLVSVACNNTYDGYDENVLCKVLPGVSKREVLDMLPIFEYILFSTRTLAIVSYNYSSHQPGTLIIQDLKKERFLRKNELLHEDALGFKTRMFELVPHWISGPSQETFEHPHWMVSIRAEAKSKRVKASRSSVFMVSMNRHIGCFQHSSQMGLTFTIQAPMKLCHRPIATLFTRSVGKICESASEEHGGDSEREENEEKDDQIERRRKLMEVESLPRDESVGTDLNS
ncbi:tRNA (guanine(9)-N1)-methyltransferase-like protein [Actinidia rufa]|uniref:tRNA (guanine(9)-N(1))-methyltransferase n=1 Tax=Actinidia rufa TaxID=165716 RepID=A0A7J0E1A4_9ERIC|nr:tRNA (guanine(9)-N1)-methyltransferase-like protein [Actinidia rufa]